MRNYKRSSWVLLLVFETDYETVVFTSSLDLTCTYQAILSAREALIRFIFNLAIMN